MSLNSFDDLMNHVGHKMECVSYGCNDDPDSISIECLSCGSVLADFNNPAREEVCNRCGCDLDTDGSCPECATSHSGRINQ